MVEMRRDKAKERSCIQWRIKSGGLSQAGMNGHFRPSHLGRMACVAYRSNGDIAGDLE